MASKDLTTVLEAEGVAFELLPHGHTETALAEAEALGLDPADVAKTIVVETPDGYARAVLPASERLDVRKLSSFLGAGTKKVHLATEDALKRDYGEFELGAVPPVGGKRSDPVVIDQRLAGRETIVLEAGTHDESIRIARADLVRLAHARVADIAQD